MHVCICANVYVRMYACMHTCVYVCMVWSYLWCGIVWYDLVWYGMVWYGVVWVNACMHECMSVGHGVYVGASVRLLACLYAHVPCEPSTCRGIYYIHTYNEYKHININR